MRAYLFVALIGLAGCGGEEYGLSYSVLIDPNLPAEDQAASFVAVQNWVAISDGRLHMSASIGKAGECTGNVDHQICIHASTSDWIIANGGEPTFVGYTIRDGSNDSSHIYIPVAKDVGYDAATQTVIVSHEIGHSLGNLHSERGSIMCASLGCASYYITCSDYDQAMSYRGLSSIDKSCPHGGTFTLTGN